MQLESARLIFYPIGDEEIEKLIENEKDPALKQAYSEMLEGCRREPEIRIWFAPWVMELRSRPSVVVGDFGFKGISSDGMVEIGYGLREGFCGNGYMTEAVKVVSQWALNQPNVSRVEAETDPDNAASQKILAACGFVPTGAVGEEGPRFVLRKSEK